MALSHGIPEVNLTLGPIVDDSFLKVVERGRQGLNMGMSGSLKLVNKLYGIQKSRYYLIGAHPNVGKTQFVDFIFVFTLWLKAKEEGKPIRIFYVSLELSATEKKAKWCSMYLKWKYDLDWSSSFILGRIPKNLPSDDDMKLIHEAYTFVELMLKDVSILDSAVTPSMIEKDLISNYYSKLGTILRADVTAEEKKKGLQGMVKQFIPYQEIPLTLLVIDHLALLSGRKMKETMDEMSISCVRLRNVFGLSPILVQQFNQDLIKSRRESLMRNGAKGAHNVIAPQQLDFGDSTYTFRDADIVIGLVKPHKFELETFDGFPCTPPQFGGLGDCLLAPYVIKNRYGNINLMFPLFMNGLSGMFYDLPDDLDPDLTPWISQAFKLSQNG